MLPNFLGFSVPGLILPSALIYHNTTQAIATGNFTVESQCNSTLWDTHNFHRSQDMTRLTIPSGLDGLYWLGTQCNFVANSSNHRGIYLKVNTTIVAYTFQLHNVAISVPLMVATIRPLFAGDYVYQVCYQNGAATLNITEYPAHWIALVRLCNMPANVARTP
jgi:hypothetical protein